MRKQINPLVLIVVLIAIAAGSRFLPHWHNFTAMGAAGLVGAAYLPKRYFGIIIPLIALFISDLILNNLIYAHYFEGFVWFGKGAIWIYVAFAVLVLGGSVFLKKIKALNLIAAGLVGSVLFFLISNFGSFLIDPIYVKSPLGLVEAYVAGIPFFWNTLLANVVFTLLLVGVFEWASQRSLRAVIG